MQLQELKTVLANIEANPLMADQSDIDRLAELYLKVIEDPDFADGDEFTALDARFEAVSEVLNPDGADTFRDPRRLLTLPVL